MSYRIYLTRPDGKQFQLFGNNEYPKRFIKYLKKYSCEMDEDGGFNDFEVINFNEFFGTIESFIQDTIKHSQTQFFNYENQYEDILKLNTMDRTDPNWPHICNRPITIASYNFLSYSYVFEGVRVLQFLEDYLEKSLDKVFCDIELSKDIKLKEECQLYLSGS